MGFGDQIHNTLFLENNDIADTPVYFHIETANKCNLRCKMCGKNKWNISNNNMSLETFAKIISKIDKASLITLFGLGEPLTNPDIFKMIRICKERGIPTAFTTNGYLLDLENRKEVIKSGLDFIRFSVDTVEPPTNNIGHDYSETVLDNIKKMVLMSSENKKPIITFNTTVHNANVGEVKKVIAYAKDLRIDGVNLIAVVPEFSSVSVKKMSLEEGLKIYRELVDFGKSIGFSVWGSGFYERTGGNSRLKWKFCPRTTDYLYVNEFGDVTPCCWMPRYKIGNIFEQSISEIWHGNECERFRENWRQICGDCSLMK